MQLETCTRPARAWLNIYRSASVTDRWSLIRLRRSRPRERRWARPRCRSRPWCSRRRRRGRRRRSWCRWWRYCRSRRRDRCSCWCGRRCRSCSCRCSWCRRCSRSRRCRRRRRWRRCCPWWLVGPYCRRIKTRITIKIICNASNGHTLHRHMGWMKRCADHPVAAFPFGLINCGSTEMLLASCPVAVRQSARVGWMTELKIPITPSMPVA